MPVELEMTLRVLLAAALGGAIGYQRAAAHKPAGVRTHSLIVTGVGFLGAGAIIRREGGMVGGLTTTASIWVVAALGLAAGMGLYVIAATVGAIVLVVLFFPSRGR